MVTMNPARSILEGGYLLIEDGIISSVGMVRPDGPFDRIIDARGCLLIPGLINTHHHLYQSLTRVVPFVQDAKLFDWLLGLYEIWRELSPQSARVGASLGLAELLLSGCTTVADHYYLFPQSQPETLLDESIKAAQELGIRFHPTRGSMSLGRGQGGLPPDDVVQPEAQILEDCRRVVERYHDPERYSMCRVGLAPCSPFSVTTKLLEQTATLARDLGVRMHTHLAETLDENEFCLKQHGVRPLKYMAQVGWLGSDVWYAHGVHFNDAELDRLAETGTGVAHCPISNLRLGSGIARVPEMLDRGVPVGLAVDGSASNDGGNLLIEARIATLIHRVGTGVDQMPAQRALELATLGSAKVLGRDDIGALAPGMAADMALFDLRDIAYAGALSDPVAALLMTAGPARARTVLVNGRVLVDEGRLLNIDSEALYKEANAISQSMREQMQQRTGLNPLLREKR